MICPVSCSVIHAFLSWVYTVYLFISFVSIGGSSGPAPTSKILAVSSLSVQSPFESWAGAMNTNTSWSSTTNPLTATTNPWPLSVPPVAPSHAGVTLSPASETFPRCLVDKVQSGQFTEMKELLSDNISLLSQWWIGMVGL